MIINFEFFKNSQLVREILSNVNIDDLTFEIKNESKLIIKNNKQGNTMIRRHIACDLEESNENITKSILECIEIIKRENELLMKLRQTNHPTVIEIQKEQKYQIEICEQVTITGNFGETTYFLTKLNEKQYSLQDTDYKHRIGSNEEFFYGSFDECINTLKTWAQ